MLMKIFGASALGCVGLSVLVGIISVWFEEYLPDAFVNKSLTTLSILFAGAVISAIVTYFLIPA